ncbi:Vps54-like protein-domain-containing protein [Zychaea mexicana]|uniref:Vps54-like protein-domain-containing protein n=1 Tax=Zychaea mexicana TaxID=64656 RepID=UPI0022FF0B46|nr:Vps54-like protein-domain-containing protein [Zychaea mexicana]KAI9498334.1 Vps54-like protein-domain-containing protein [Zychaea mexicana]
MQPRSHAAGQQQQQGENGNGSSRNYLHHHHSPSWNSSSASARRHLSPNNITTASASPASPTNANSPRPTSPRTTPVHSMVRERSLHRDEGTTSSSRPPSIRSASSYGRPLNRLMHNAHTRRHSSYSNFSTMSETSLPWTTRDIGFNAISGVLNDPAKRGQTVVKPSKADVPPVPHASITKVRPSDFDNYLEHIGPVFDRYQHNKLNDEENNALTSPVISPYGSLHNILDTLDESSLPAHQRRSGRNPYGQMLSSESLALLDNVAPEPTPRELPMLENVPQIFFDPDFQLENPRTFDAVCEGADIIGNSGPNPPVSTNSILQEKLSYYLDTVEVHLIREIENRSSSFFEALSNLQALHQQTLDCVSQIHTIRQKMKEIQATKCNDGLQVVRLQVRRRNLERLQEAIRIIKEVRAAQPMIQVLLGQGDYFAALDLIDETHAVLEDNKKAGVIDLKQVRALANFSTQLDEMQKAVGIMMQHDFLSILLSDLSYQIETIDFDKAKERILDHAKLPRSPPQPREDVTDEELLERLMPSTVGLIRTDMFMQTMQGYRERLLTEIKEIVRKKYPAVSPTDEPGQNSPARQLRTMPFDSFFKMLLDVFIMLIRAIQRAAVYHKILSQLVDKCVIDDEEKKKDMKKESSDIVFAAADLAHVRCAKLIGFRSEQNAQLNPTDFYRLASVMRTFIQQCESYCERTCFGLRGTVLSQQKAFIDHFHMERVKQEAQLIENEQWVASEVPSDFQRIVDRICDGSVSSLAQEDTAPPQKQEEDRRSTKFLIVHGTSYFVVGCSLLIIKMFEDYLRCIWNLEGMTTDIMQKLVELLKLFNSRVCQVILGAGAMRSAGLKNISAKHLALASQSVGIMIGLIPSLKECVRQHMPAKHTVLLSEFDRILKDYQEHQGEIHAKLVAIMNERFSVHVKAMQVIQWDEEDESGKIPNNYMETLVKETMTLHKVLSKYLPHQNLQSIMSEVFKSFTTQLSQEISKLSITTESGKDRLAKDAAYFTKRLSSLNGIDPPSDAVVNAVNEISTSA